VNERLSHPSRRETTSSSETLPVVEEDSAFETLSNLEEKIVSMDPEGTRKQKLLC
jgi:hypothetical protein